MPPLVMPWRARKPSSVCTSTSKIALPIPRTSYFASVIHPSCFTAWCEEAERGQEGCGLPDRRSASKGSGRGTSPRLRGEVGIQAQLEFRVRGALSEHLCHCIRG